MFVDLDAMAHRLSQEFHEALETACEMAIQGGEHGVLVVHRDAYFIPDEANTNLMQLNPGWEIKVSPEVPYGMIYEVRP